MVLESSDNETNKIYFLFHFVGNRFVHVVCSVLSSLAIRQISEKRAWKSGIKDDTAGPSITWQNRQ